MNLINGEEGGLDLVCVSMGTVVERWIAEMYLKLDSDASASVFVVAVILPRRQ